MNEHKKRRLLDESCAWIRSHWNAQNTDVPDAFLLPWIYEVGENQEKPSGFHLAVFAFGYVQHDLLAHQVPTGVSRSVSAKELLQLFHAWQLKLALVEIHRRTEVRIQPMTLFAFGPNENVKFWMDRGHAAAEMPPLPLL